MLTVQGLCAQFVMLRRKYLKTTEVDITKNESKFKLQGQSARLQYWFDLNFYCIKVNVITPEPEFYRKIFLRNEDT